MSSEGGINKSINNPANIREYVLYHKEGGIPVLVPVTACPYERAKPSEEFSRIHPAVTSPVWAPLFICLS